MVGPQGPAGRSEPSGGIGLPVDYTGRQAVDPTKNVEALVKALEEKTKELREADLRLIQAKLDATKEIGDLKSRHSSDLINSLAKEISLRADLGGELTKKETDRVNAVRLVDVQAVQVATERQTQAATALASQVVQSAEVLRNQQARVQEEARISLAASNAELTKRISELERSLSEGRGKQQFQDPATIEMKAKLDLISLQQSNKIGSDKGQSDAMFYVLAALALGVPIGAAIYARKASA